MIDIFKKNSLLKNSFNLMLSTGLVALFGFVFWTVVARTFRTNTVGLATTLLSMSTLLSLLGLAGFDTVFVRFLSQSKHRNEQINSGMILAGITSAIIAGLFCLMIPLLSKKLVFVDHNPWYIICFIIVTVFTTWNTLTNAVLIAYRRTSFIVAINIIFSALKVSLPFIIRSGGPITILLLVGVAQVVNVVLSVIALMRYFDFVPSAKIHFTIVSETLHYGVAVYITNILSILPDSALPLIVVDRLGAAAAAYFFIAFTIANLLYTIAYSTAQALLAEASLNIEHLISHLRRGFIIMTGLLVPAIILVLVLSSFVLNIFGHNYQHYAIGLLRILSVSAIAVMAQTLIIFTFKLTKNIMGMILTTTVNALAIIILSLFLSKPFGLDGIGWAQFIGASLAAIVGGVYILLGQQFRDIVHMSFFRADNIKGKN